MLQYIENLGSGLPFIFAALMGFAILVYVILDGYDLGVGMLMHWSTKREKDRMIASIGPFWDANETWLVLAVGLLLVAFPQANGKILTALYLPTTGMLISLIMRGVSFDFRIKARVSMRGFWNNAMSAASLMTGIFQGYMMGWYIMGFDNTAKSHIFACFTALCLVNAYIMMGASWLIMKSEGALQKKSIKWMKISSLTMLINIIILSFLTPYLNDIVMHKIILLKNKIILLQIPAVSITIIATLYLSLHRKFITMSKYCWIPFASSATMMLTFFIGLAYILFPYIILNEMTIVEAAASNHSLAVMLIGTVVVVPLIVVYTIFAYKVFWGKAKELSYD